MTPPGEPHEITPWVPHRFWPVPDAKEDSTLIVWAHPDDADDKMDDVFFKNLLMYTSDVHEGKAKLSLSQIMLTQ